MSKKEKNTEVLKSKRFVVAKSRVGKGQVIEFTNKKGVTVKYNHDKVFSLACWAKYKSYTATNSIPTILRDKVIV